MNHKTQHAEAVEQVEQKVYKKVKRRENKKRKRMPVSGKSVFMIKKIIEEK